MGVEYRQTEKGNMNKVPKPKPSRIILLMDHMFPEIMSFCGHNISNNLIKSVFLDFKATDIQQIQHNIERFTDDKTATFQYNKQLVPSSGQI